MIPTKPLLLSASVFLAACISLPEIEAPQDPPDQNPDAGKPPSLTLTLTAPSGPTYTNGTLSVQLQLQGDTPEKVELLVDDQPLTTLTAPYSFNWDTTSTAEGPHRLAARARIGDKTFASEVREVTVDRTPPQVASRAPTPGAQDVWVRQPIQAKFSEPLKPSSVTSSSVKLVVNEIEVAATLSLSADGETLTAVPATRLQVPNTVQVIMTTALTDLAGNVLVLPSNIWTWDLPLSFPVGNLSALPGNTNATLPSLRLDRSGKLLVSWVELTDTTSPSTNIYVYGLAGNDWSSASSPITLSGSNLLSPSPFYVFRLDSAGTPVIAWTQLDVETASDPVNTHIQRWSGSEWLAVSTPPNTSLGPQVDTLQFTFLLDGNERPIIAGSFADRRNPHFTPLLVRQWTGSSWMDFGTQASTNPPLSAGYNGLLLSSTGNPVVAWSESDIYVRRWTGAGWANVGNTLGVFPGDTPAVFGDMLLDSSDNPIVAWVESDGTTQAVYVARFTGGEWEALGGPLQAIPNAKFVYDPRLQLDNDGNLLVAWDESSAAAQSASFQINLRRWTGTAWATIGAPITLSQGNDYRLNISFLMDKSGNPYIAWPESTSSTAQSIRIHRYNY